MRKNNRGQWENITDYVHIMLSFVDLSHVNEFDRKFTITFNKRLDLYKFIVV